MQKIGCCGNRHCIVDCASKGVKRKDRQVNYGAVLKEYKFNLWDYLEKGELFKKKHYNRLNILKNEEIHLTVNSEGI